MMRPTDLALRSVLPLSGGQLDNKARFVLRQLLLLLGDAGDALRLLLDVAVGFQELLSQGSLLPTHLR